ncbi:hypothetical protein [Streptomyces sp. NPDC052015]|uniref:hypothetical protein n=1 Tax=Streptomyces sp. NPDC052015 TaxID=3154755 RepID=UPI0034231835
MAAHGGTGPEKRTRGFRLDEYAEMNVPRGASHRSPAGDAPSPSAVTPLWASLEPPARAAAPSPDAVDEHARDRRGFPAVLGEFRRTAVLVPLVVTDGDEAPLAADFGGIRWIYAFSDESALARFAIARGEGAREWPYRRVLGARLLDAGVGATGVPCGVALDVGGDGDGVLFPPVAGIVPDAVAVDTQMENGEGPR